MRIKSALINNIGLKVLALILAFVTWLYVGEAAKINTEKSILQRVFSSSYASSQLKVRPVFVGNAPEGYRFLESEAKVTPQSVMLIGPAKILSKKEFIYTKPIDLSEYTVTKTFEIELQSITPSIKLQKAKVQVCVPVEKLPAKE